MRITVFTVLIISFLSCDRQECLSGNPVFAGNSPSSKAYKDELLKELDKPHNASPDYWFKSYEERDSKTYLQFYVQDDSLCAVAELLVKDWSDKKISNIKKVKGMSYGGEAVGIKFRVEKDTNHTELIYVDMDQLID